MSPQHAWDKSSLEVFEIDGRKTRRKKCRHCGLQASFIQSGDVEIDRRYLVAGVWRIMRVPSCVRPTVRKARKKEWTEAQRVTFQGPIAPRRF